MDYPPKENTSMTDTDPDLVCTVCGDLADTADALRAHLDRHASEVAR